MSRSIRPFAWRASFLIAFLTAPAWADTTVTLEGDIPDSGPDHFFLPFEVPAGTEEIEIHHVGTPSDNVLDFGLNDPSGYRGWGGGTSENVVIGAHAASRAYVPGPMTVGTWKVVVGKAKIVASPARYKVDVTLRTQATLPAQNDRKAYVPSGPLKKEARFYAMDFHVHSKESTDAVPELEQIALFAESRGLDAVEISDHNTITQLDYFTDLQTRHPDLLFIPGIEFTTYAGHANAIGATKWVDHKIGQPGVTILGAAQEIVAQGALFSINHPMLDLGNRCIGCAWKHEIPTDQMSAIEIETGDSRGPSGLFSVDTFKLWDSLSQKGHHLAAIGGSDDHKGGADPNSSAIGSPTTLVFANELSVAGVLEGIRNGRTVVKMHAPTDPMIDFISLVAPVKDTIAAKTTIFRAHITDVPPLPEHTTARLVINGSPQAAVAIEPGSAPTLEFPVIAPTTGVDFYRIEVLVDRDITTVTSNLFLRYDAAGPDYISQTVGPISGGGEGCASAASPHSSSWAYGLAIALAAMVGLRRRIRR